MCRPERKSGLWVSSDLFWGMRVAAQNPKFRFTKAEEEWMGEANLAPGELMEEVRLCVESG